ncbi:MAG TPA: stage V sporulation protein AC [Clostridiales bacterium]|nr:stage V sporulation protein AC [Clostridiales bacterium]
MQLKILTAFIGLSEGFVVGTAFVAFLTILDIIPRLAQLTGTEAYMRVYEIAMIVTVVTISLADFLFLEFNMGKIVVVGVGFLMGGFIGLLASALTEVLNVIPVLLGRLNLQDYTKYILISLASGKVVGSLLYWIFLNP